MPTNIHDFRDPLNTPLKYWGTKMNFYWFGVAESSSIITSGLFEPVEGEEDRMVYGAVINCASQTWMTVYQNSSMSSQQMWKQGALWEPCQVGIFDLIFEMVQLSKGSFIFNGQPLEDAVYPKMKKNQQRQTLENTGKYQSQKLPISFKKATKVHGSITDGFFDRYAYGKCFAFPNAFLNDCTGAKAWVQSRNKVNNMELQTFGGSNADNDAFPVTEDTYQVRNK